MANGPRLPKPSGGSQSAPVNLQPAISLEKRNVGLLEEVTQRFAAGNVDVTVNVTLTRRHVLEVLVTHTKTELRGVSPE